MRLIIRDPWFWLIAGVFILHQVAEKGLGLRFPLVDAYLDDLLCMPILLCGWMAEQHDLFGKKEVRGIEVAGIWLLVSVIFEGWLPRHYPQYTADIWDVVCYGVGTLFFYGVMIPDCNKRRSASIPGSIRGEI